MSASLRSLSDREILSRTQELTRRERSLTLSVLLHLNEIEKRKLHLMQGYASMFDYCTTGLGYSASAAIRRIRTARCVARFPEVYELLESNEVNLSTVSKVSRILNAANVGSVLARIRGMSQREVEAIVAEYQPRAALPDIVRSVVVRVPTASGAADTADATGSNDNIPVPQTACEKSAYNRSGCAQATPDIDPVSPRTENDGPPRFERRSVIQFSASEAFMAKLEKVRSLAWHRLPANASLEQVFELALDLVIAREDPSVRSERRRRRVARHDMMKPASSAGAPADGSRRVAAGVRDEVFTRDNGQCTFVGANGIRCSSTRAIQIDHVTPVARGGPSTSGNLRLLCAYHNRLEAERILGTGQPRRSAARVPRSLRSQRALAHRR